MSYESELRQLLGYRAGISSSAEFEIYDCVDDGEECRTKLLVSLVIPSAEFEALKDRAEFLESL